MQIENQVIPPIETFGHIYKITNKINGKCYIGQTINDPVVRWYKYKHLECKDQPKLYNALKKYGPENFLYESIDISATDQEKLNYLEDFYIKQFNSKKNGYNIKDGGSNGKHSKETKRKISDGNKGKNKNKKLSEKIKQKISEAHIGIKFSKEHKMNMSKNHSHYWSNKRHSNETKQKISCATSGINNPMYGKIGENHPAFGRTGKLAPMYGRSGEFSPWFGRKHSNETKQKMKDAWVKRKAQKLS